MKKIGRYIIRGLLGRGGMGKVYKVTLPIIEKTFALKLLDPDPLVESLMGKSAMRAAFEKEAVTMAGLRHRHIVSITDFDEADGKLFYVMDFHASSLGTIMGESAIVDSPSRPIPVDSAIRYVLQSLEGLRRLHSAGIIHRDIKPHNLLITPEDRIKICDFGLSRLRGEVFSGPRNLNVGSPYYAAPEQEQNPDRIDVRADLYPLGIIFYRLLSGCLPTIGPGAKSYTPLVRHNPDLDGNFDAFVTCAAATEPESRYGSAEHMLAALTDLDAHWQQKKEQTCRLPVDPVAVEPCAIKKPPRKNAIKADPQTAMDLFGVDPLWRPRVYTPGDFSVAGPGVVLDRCTGLYWQQAGSAYPNTWSGARDDIAGLNQRAFGGMRNWRLPTINELMTLLTPVPQGEALCIAPVFDTTQRWLWGADRRSFTASYYVDAELAFVGWQDCSAPFYSRAVCDAST